MTDTHRAIEAVRAAMKPIQLDYTSGVSGGPDGDRATDDEISEWLMTYREATEPSNMRLILAELDAARAALEVASKDAGRLDWLDAQKLAYGFADIHEGNQWLIEGPFATLRAAIDAASTGETHV